MRTLVDSVIRGNSRVLDIIELDTELYIFTENDIKLIEFVNTAVNSVAIEDSRTLNIAEVDPKLDMLIGSLQEKSSGSGSNSQ